MDSIIVCMVSLPGSVPGLTRKNEDGSYTILINVNLSADSQRLAYMHEVSHIYANDFTSPATANAIESIRH